MDRWDHPGLVSVTFKNPISKNPSQEHGGRVPSCQTFICPTPGRGGHTRETPKGLREVKSCVDSWTILCCPWLPFPTMRQKEYPELIKTCRSLEIDSCQKSLRVESRSNPSDSFTDLSLSQSFGTHLNLRGRTKDKIESVPKLERLEVKEIDSRL